MKRSSRLLAAQETVEIVHRGSYTLPDGRVVDISAAVRECLDATRYYEPHELKPIHRQALAQEPLPTKTRIEVRNETTLAGIARLLAEDGGPVAALNFASAKNPGGGFLNGSEAQEESLARSSALYASLLRAPAYYSGHRASRSLLYSDAMIVSPACPIFRDDDGRLLERPHVATFLTSPAPNAGAIDRRERPQLEPTLRRRAGLVLALAAHHGYRRLVLGAWGCGVFRNDPTTVASIFAEHLAGVWANRFERVLFSVLDTSQDQSTLRAFEAAFT
jgi:uncharacterized protein (TIGR02452 family)